MVPFVSGANASGTCLIDAGLLSQKADTARRQAERNLKAHPLPKSRAESSFMFLDLPRQQQFQQEQMSTAVLKTTLFLSIQTRQIRSNTPH